MRWVALISKPVLDRSRNRLFVSSAGTSFNCINAKTGQIIWTNPKEKTASVSLVEPKVSPSNQRVYTIQVRFYSGGETAEECIIETNMDLLRL